MKRITRNRRLTSGEAAKYNAIRALVKRDKPETDANIRQQIANNKRKAAAERDHDRRNP